MAAVTTTANNLKSATTIVNVSAATAPISGQGLVATGPTAATWQTVPTVPVSIINGGTGGTTLSTAYTNLSPYITDTDGSTVTFDLSTGKKHQVTVAGNRTFALSNVVIGDIFHIRYIQNGTGNFTPTWFSGITWLTNDGLQPTPNLNASTVTVFGFECTASGTYDGYLVGKQGGSVSIVEVTGTTQQMINNVIYVANNASRITFTLPVTSPFGSTLGIYGKGAGGWKVAQNASQTIYSLGSSSTTGATGSVSSGTQRDTIWLSTVTADIDFDVTVKNGTYSFV